MKAFYGAEAYRDDFVDTTLSRILPQNAFGPRTDNPVSPEAYRLSIVAPFLHHSEDPERAAELTALLKHDPHLRRTLEAEEARSGLAMDRYDAVFPSSERAGEIPEEEISIVRSLDHPMSVTGIEDFARCPFLFYARHILRLEPLEEPERLPEASPLDVGQLYHTILRRFFAELRDEGLLPLRAESRGEATERLLRVVEEELIRFEREKPTGAPLLWHRQRRAITRAMEQIIDIEMALGSEGALPLPHAMEVAFGRQPQSVSDPRFSKEEPLLLSFIMEDGRSVELPIRGKIDRVDRVPLEEPHLIVRDYKSGSPRSVSDQAKGTLFSLPAQAVLYYLAARDLLFEEPVSRFAYYYVGEKADPSAPRHIEIKAEEIEDQLPNFRKVLARMQTMILKGVFFPNVFQDHAQGWCRRCEYKDVCRKHPVLREKIRHSRYSFFSGEEPG